MHPSEFWREKTKVLCLFRYWGRVSGSTVSFDDSVMIEVEFRDQIETTFQRAIQARRPRWTVGPTPQRWELTGWIPEHPFVAYEKVIH